MRTKLMKLNNRRGKVLQISGQLYNIKILFASFACNIKAKKLLLSKFKNYFKTCTCISDQPTFVTEFFAQGYICRYS